MKKLSIQIIDAREKISYGIPSCIGEVTINDFKETFDMPLDFWNKNDYQSQWKQGIERIKNNLQSCLVAEVQDPKIQPRASIWALYKVDEKIYIQNHLLFGKRFAKMLKNIFLP